MESIPRRGESPGAQGPPIVRPVHPLRPWAIGALVWAILLPLSASPRMSGNVWSRYMTIESIVERGTLAIDRSPMVRRSGTPDLAKYGDRLYADKPPVLSVLGAAIYAPLSFSGLRIFGSPAEFATVNLVLVSSVVGLASVLTLAWLRWLLQVTRFRPWVSDLLTLGFGLGSPLLTYGVTFNNHSVAAGLLTAAFGLVLLEDLGCPRVGRRRFLAGLLAGLAATIDLPAGGAMVMALGSWLAIRARAVPWAFLAGAAGPALLHIAAQSMISGSPLPVELDHKAMEYPGSYWTTETGRWKEPGPRWRFGLELLVGPGGWLTITPVLAFAPIGLYAALRRGPGPLRAGTALVVIVVAALLAFYVWGVRRTDYAGLSFGVRHLLAITPVVYFFALVGLDHLPSRFARLLFAVLFASGAVYAFEGMKDPWSRAERRTEPVLRVLQRFVLYPWTSYTR